MISAGSALLADAADPTGLSSTAGKLIILAGLIAVLLVLLMQWKRRP